MTQDVSYDKARLGCLSGVVVVVLSFGVAYLDAWFLARRDLACYGVADASMGVSTLLTILCGGFAFALVGCTAGWLVIGLSRWPRALTLLSVGGSILIVLAIGSAVLVWNAGACST